MGIVQIVLWVGLGAVLGIFIKWFIPFLFDKSKDMYGYLPANSDEELYNVGRLVNLLIDEVVNEAVKKLTESPINGKQDADSTKDSDNK